MPTLSTDDRRWKGSDKHAHPHEKQNVPELPVHERVPTELLADVFVLAVNNEAVVFPPNFSNPQWVLSRVCRRWRNAALGEPRIWSRIKVWSVDEGLTSKLFALIKHILPVKALLSITTGSHNGRTTLDPDFSVSVMEQLIRPELPRVRELQLNLNSSGYIQFFTTSSESFVSLEALDISFDSDDVEMALATQIVRRTMIFSRAHRLRALRVSSNSGRLPNLLVLSLLDSPIPWHQLVRLDFRPCALFSQQIHFILRQSPALEIFRAIMNGSPEETTVDDDIVLPRLRSLTLWLGRSLVLKPLILPALKYLHFDGLLTSSSYAEISHMISRSRCSLDVFEGCGRVSSDTDLMNELMSCMPTVQKFTADTLWLEDTTFNMIGRGELLPRVTHLTCGLNTTKAFVDALEYRLTTGRETKSDVKPLQLAIGQCPRLRACTESEMSEAVARLDALNERYGTRYTIEWIVASRE